MSRTTLPCIAAILMLSGSPARADAPREPAPAAKPFVDAGIAAYKAGDYEAAVRELSAAYRLDPQPAILYAWAQALRLGKRCAEAIPVYRRYLATDPTEAQIAAAQHGISLCEKAQPAEPPPKTSEGTGTPEDTGTPEGTGAPEGTGTPEQPPETPETPEMTPPVSGPPDTPAQRRWYADRLGGGLAIGGAVSLGVGIGFLVRSSQNRSAAGEATFRNDFIEALDTATLQRRVGVAGLCVGAALVTGGILRYTIERRREEARSVSIAITGRSLVVVGRF